MPYFVDDLVDVLPAFVKAEAGAGLLGVLASIALGGVPRIPGNAGHVLLALFAYIPPGVNAILEVVPDFFQEGFVLVGLWGIGHSFGWPGAFVSAPWLLPIDLRC